MPVYLRFLTIFFLFPILLLWLIQSSYLKKYPKTFALTVLFTFLFGVPWDTLSVKTGLWRYNSAPTLGVWFGPPAGGLPLEEYLFTLLFPIFVVSLTLTVKYYWQRQK